MNTFVQTIENSQDQLSLAFKLPYDAVIEALKSAKVLHKCAVSTNPLTDLRFVKFFVPTELGKGLSEEATKGLQTAMQTFNQVSTSIHKELLDNDVDPVVANLVLPRSVTDTVYVTAPQDVADEIIKIVEEQRDLTSGLVRDILTAVVDSVQADDTPKS